VAEEVVDLAQIVDAAQQHGDRLGRAVRAGELAACALIDAAEVEKPGSASAVA
jgi:hypothetical protein